MESVKKRAGHRRPSLMCRVVGPPEGLKEDDLDVILTHRDKVLEGVATSQCLSAPSGKKP